MPNEINVSAALNITKAGATAAGQFNLSQTLAGAEFAQSIIPVLTTTTTLLDRVDTPGGWVLVKNLDPTNSVIVSLDNAQANIVATLLPGEATLFKPAATTVYGKASGATCNVAVVAADL